MHARPVVGDGTVKKHYAYAHITAHVNGSAMLIQARLPYKGAVFFLDEKHNNVYMSQMTSMVHDLRVQKKFCPAQNRTS